MKEEAGFWYKADTGFTLLPRWEVLFNGENIDRWITKIVKGCELRKLMDNLLRFNYYVDNMPIDDLIGLETQIQTAVMDKISYDFDKAQLDPLMDEMNQSFTKLQNEVLFKKHLEGNGDSGKMFSKELKLDFRKKKSIPYFGRIQLKREKEVVALNLGKIIKSEAKTFDERFKAFGLASLYSIKEVINAMDAIKHECL
jgi:dynein heavy chain, axonemal